MKLLSWVLFLTISGQALAAPGDTTTATFVSNTDQATSITYHVFADGHGDFPTIKDALAAATDPLVDKYIELGPGTFQFPLDVNTRLQMTVPRTHLVGDGPDSTKIVASSGKGRNSWGVLEVRAIECTVKGVWVDNRWKEGDIPGKQTAIALGSAEDPTLEPDALTTMTGIRISNSKFTATTKDRHSDDLAWDVVTVGGNVTDCVFDNCEMRGFADVFSTWARNVRVQNSTIYAKGWNAIWVAGSPNEAIGQTQGISTYSNCRLASSHYYIAGGATDTNFAMPVAYLENCSSANEDGSIPEAARMIGSKALAIIIGNTPFQPFGAVSGGPKGLPPSVVSSDVMLRRKLRIEGNDGPTLLADANGVKIGQGNAIVAISRFKHTMKEFNLAAGQIQSENFECPGVEPGDVVTVTPAGDPEESGIVTWSSFVSAPDNVEVRFRAGPDGATTKGGIPLNIMVSKF